MSIIIHITEVGIVLIILIITTILSIAPHTIQIGTEAVITTLGIAVTLHTTIALTGITTITATLMVEGLLDTIIHYMENHLLETREIV